MITRVVGVLVHEVDLLGTLVEVEVAPLGRLHLVAMNKCSPNRAFEVCLVRHVGALNLELPSRHGQLGQGDLKCLLLGNGNSLMLQEERSSSAWDVLRKNNK